MANTTVRVLARITARPDKIEELTPILRGLVGETRKESGCISYQLLQNRADPGDFTFVEEWESDSAIDSHFITAHLQNAFSEAASLLMKEPDIRRYYVIA
ncbi:antibiotic biosynthesis monooxygenase [Nitrosospira lacus]|uniref:Antibiotic biosynthesis monooxygenase n=1 Tax=Nitrosospira lacus TaxID=1288494 RepID=A0A1W6SMF6_9PROT|nr:putative quinol monooxygenase [Nitrosospira lacus]ARO86971.1 antibiotic biosynthesis monooxygenase [Nitrosospira lacus]